jgi:glycine oxidase
VVVAGAGPIGAASAWRLAERGLRVALVDPQPGSGAAHAAAGMLAPITEATPGEDALTAAGLASVARYPDFVGELEEQSGCTVGYRREGTLSVALDAADAAELRRSAALYARLGLAAELLTSRECRRVEPLLSPEVTGGVFVAGDHQVDPRRLTPALVIAAQRAGAQLVSQRVRTVLLDDPDGPGGPGDPGGFGDSGGPGSSGGPDGSGSSDGSDGQRVVGVELDNGARLAASTVVLAAGCWTSRIGGLEGTLVGEKPVVRPVKGQVLRLRVPGQHESFLGHTVRGWVHGVPVYLVPRADGTVVVGATQEERGYDQTVTAGAVHDLLRDAQALLPAVSELAWVEACAGLRPGSPDNAPLIGVGATGPTGLVLATGHHRNGILLTPLTADAVVECVLQGATTGPMAAFSPDRLWSRPAAPAVSAAPAGSAGGQVASQLRPRTAGGST